MTPKRRAWYRARDFKENSEFECWGRILTGFVTPYVSIKSKWRHLIHMKNIQEDQKGVAYVIYVSDEQATPLSITRGHP